MNEKKLLAGETVETKPIPKAEHELTMSIATLQPEDIVYIYGILSVYRSKTEKSVEKIKKDKTAKNRSFENDPQYIFESAELTRMDNVIKKLFALRKKISE